MADLVQAAQAIGSQKQFSAGEWLVHEGTEGDVMFVIEDGMVEVSVRGETVLLASHGDIIGEMALLDTKARSASAQAKTDCTVSCLDRSQFVELVTRYPEISLYLMSILVERLRTLMRRL